MSHGQIDEREEADAFEVNQILIHAVMLGDRRAITRALEDGAHLWLAGSHCRSEDPEVNPALAALLSPAGPDAIQAFDDFFGDLRDWTFGRWRPSQWAVAQKSEWALRWSIEGREGAAELLMREEAGEGSSKPRRTALSICAQMGDPKWLSTVLKVAAEMIDMQALAQSDSFSEPTAMGMALFELADQARGGASPGELRERAKIVEILAKKGFKPEGRGRSAAAKLCVALALADPKHAGNIEMAAAARLACRMGSAAPEGEPRAHGPSEAAGWALDLEWSEANRNCAIKESGYDSFGFGASKRLLRDLRERSRHAGEMAQWRPKKIAQLRDAIEKSLSACSIPLHERPLAGLESECLLWLAREPGEQSAEDAFKERVELALTTAKAELGAKPAAMRL